MTAPALQFAAESGCRSPSPAQLAAFEAIRQHGIREARKAHLARKLVTDAIKRDPGLITAMIRPAQSIDEALEDIKHWLIAYWNAPTHRRQARRFEANKVKTLRVNLRFFRRFADKIMAREAA
jgi:hypothetical protein